MREPFPAARCAPNSLLPLAVRCLLATALSACGGESASAPPRCTIARPTLSSGRLRADGTRFRDEHGRVVTLRGLNTGTRSKWAPYAPFDFAQPDPGGASYRAALARYLDGAASLGVNVLRVPFSWQGLEPERGRLDEAYLARYDLFLDEAWKRGLRTIVDFHQDVYAENFCGDGFPAWTIDAGGQPLPAPHHDCKDWFLGYSTPEVKRAFDRFWADGGGIQADYVAMWKRMVARHKGRAGVVGFEPINEPSEGSAERALFEPSTLTSFHGKMAMLINAEAPEALVFVDPLGITSALHSTLLLQPPGKNLVYAPHYYQGGTISGGAGNPRLLVPDLTMLKQTGDLWKVPTFVGEWGSGNESGDARDYVTAHLGAFDALELSGTEWEYSLSAERWNLEPLNIALDPQPGDREARFREVAGAWLRPTAVAIAGTPVEVTWDAESFAFTLRYQAASSASDGPEGVTEISLPGAAVPSGKVRALEGACYDDQTPGVLLLRANPSGGEVRLDYGPVLLPR